MIVNIIDNNLIQENNLDKILGEAHKILKYQPPEQVVTVFMALRESHQKMLQYGSDYSGSLVVLGDWQVAVRWIKRELKIQIQIKLKNDPNPLSIDNILMGA